MRKGLIKNNYSMVRRFRKIRNAIKLNGWLIGTASSLMQSKFFRNLYRQVFGKPTTTINVMGFKFTVDMSDPGLSWQLITRGHREVEHVNDIKRHLCSGMTGIDLGANIGYFALIEASLIEPSGRLYCIEPVSENVRLLRKNISDNGFSNCALIFRNLVGSEKGKLKIILTEESNSHHVFYGHGDVSKNKNYEEVEVTSIDDFMDINGLRPEDINFLRCDLEGYEVVAFKGMVKILEAKTPFHLFLELHPDVYCRWGTDIETVATLLVSYGFKFKRVVKEFPTMDGRDPVSEILVQPSLEEYLDKQKNWPVGGVQVHLERE